MKHSNVPSWRDAFLSSPGPRSVGEAVVLALKGLCMGAADVVPGVSGGTVALITGIYDRLVRAIGSIDGHMLKHLARLDLKSALAGLHLRFLLTLFAGIGVAIISLARLMNYLLHYQPVFTWSLFFGLIGASILVVGRRVSGWWGTAGLTFILGILAALVIVNLIPFSTPENPWFIFLCGLVAICAMILPGISGAFILLILGKYEFITAALKNPFLPSNLSIILVFCCGCAVGLLGFSRLLKYLLQRYANRTLAFLTGLMTGSMWKIWPWKEVLETVVEDGKRHFVWGGNILPPRGDNAQVLSAAVLAAVGFMMVLAIERLSRAHESKSH
jgi:putative membrane protein